MLFLSKLCYNYFLLGSETANAFEITNVHGMLADLRTRKYQFRDNADSYTFCFLTVILSYTCTDENACITALHILHLDQTYLST